MAARRDRKPNMRGILQELLRDIDRNVPMEIVCTFCGGIAYAFPQPQPKGRVVCPRCSFNGAAARVKAERDARWEVIARARADGDEKRAEQLHREFVAWMGTCPGRAA